MSITLDSFVIRTGGLMSAVLEQEIVILNPAGENYVGLDEIGRRVWELLAERSEVREVCHQITCEFQGEPLQITADLLVFLNQLAAEGLVNVEKA